MRNREERLSDSIVSNYEILNNMTVELVARCLNNMRKSKAYGPDNLCAKHPIVAHLSVAVHLRRLFHADSLAWICPKQFRLRCQYTVGKR